MITTRPDHRPIGDLCTGYCRSMGTPVYGVILEAIWPDYPGGFGWYYRMKCSDGQERFVECQPKGRQVWGS